MGQEEEAGKGQRSDPARKGSAAPRGRSTALRLSLGEDVMPLIAVSEARTHTHSPHTEMGGTSTPPLGWGRSGAFLQGSAL